MIVVPAAAALGAGGIGRRSRLFDDGTRVALADLHNHTRLSDGRGDPGDAYGSLRAQGLDIAALTDHAIVGHGPLSDFDPCAALPDAGRGHKDRCRSVIGLNDSGWRRARALAAAADDPGQFAALHGFEWSHAVLGHLNVWLSAGWIDPLHTTGIAWDGIATELGSLPGVGGLLERLFEALPGDRGMAAMYEWLSGPEGADGLAGFNHPGREPGWFDTFRYDPRVAERVVSVELFNKFEDFLFDDRKSSPLGACLDAGWRVGILGVSDEHGDDWGVPEGKGRGGLWVSELSRSGVREALAARRFFATNLRALRLDAAAGDTRMGGAVEHVRGPLEFRVDLDLGGSSAGRTLEIQVLRPGAPGSPGAVPAVPHIESLTLGPQGDALVAFSVDLNIDDGAWVVLRIADPEASNSRPGPAGHPGNRRALAYASPFWLDARWA